MRWTWISLRDAVRIAEQIVHSPEVDLGLSTHGTALFVLFIGVYASQLRGHGAQAGGLFGLGTLLGFAGDTAIKGTLASLDLSWHNEVWAALFNSRPKESARFFAELVTALWEASEGVTGWPTHDLFRQFAIGDVGLAQAMTSRR